MIVNQVNLAAAFTAFNVVFQNAFNAAPTSYEQIATTVASTTSREVYPWLGRTTKFREWLGDRAVQALATHGFTIENKHFENTVSINVNDFEDDSYGIYTPLIAQLGQDAKVHPDILIFNLLKTGASSLCYDGQYYFDTDHPGFAADGSPTTVSNYQAGAGPAWYLMYTGGVVKPLIFQKRRDYKFTPMTAPDSENVFRRNEYVYGSDARVNAGYGLWQFAFCSQQPLTPDNYGAARAAMASLRGENGDSLGIVPDLLVVPPALEGAGNTILKAELINQTSNVWKGTANLLMSPRLA